MSDAINFFPVERHWFLTWTTYGTWLPGDDRGFIGKQSDESGQTTLRNEPNTPPASPNPNLEQYSETLLKVSPIVLDIDQAEALLAQFLETASYRHWLLIAVGIMRTHIHMVVGVPGDPEADKILGDFKAYGSRCLNQSMSGQETRKRWTRGGSKRRLRDEPDIQSAVNYIRQQEQPLLIWTRFEGVVYSARSGVPPAG